MLESMNKKTLVIIGSSIIGLIVFLLIVVWLISIIKPHYYTYEEFETKVSEAAKSYYTSGGNMPENIGESSTINLDSMINKKLVSGEFNVDKVAEMTVQKYLDSEIHKKNEKEVIDAQAQKITELNKYKALHDARNVLADVDDGK